MVLLGAIIGLRSNFIVHRGNESLFRTLTNTLENELDVLVIYDRRDGNQQQLRGTQDRRVSSNVQ